MMWPMLKNTTFKKSISEQDFLKVVLVTKIANSE